MENLKETRKKKEKQRPEKEKHEMQKMIGAIVRRKKTVTPVLKIVFRSYENQSTKLSNKEKIRMIGKIFRIMFIGINTFCNILSAN